VEKIKQDDTEQKTKGKASFSLIQNRRDKQIDTDKRKKKNRLGKSQAGRYQKAVEEKCKVQKKGRDDIAETRRQG